eukprot:CAMPEP_0118924204 /NCGR_PEP_ID=MMETSP1169-20130426/2446_1 /TAXON_ID=36882 /ORGANISM="Pyramimonas obovata, Strain CCMP722" /LENGTH=598 /DNA_ID=CAMNT_0006865295 /DNA_START=246 /DNA_END=2038 /DNA_ORIENTATION=+
MASFGVSARGACVLSLRKSASAPVFSKQFSVRRSTSALSRCHRGLPVPGLSHASHTQRIGGLTRTSSEYSRRYRLLPCWATSRMVASVATVEKEETTTTSAKSEMVLLDVTGMKCAGCSGAVQRVLDAQPELASASVNLLTNSAAVWVDEQGAESPDVVAQKIAQVITDKGFPATVRPSGLEAAAEAASLAKEKRVEEVRQANLDLAFAWLLAGVCIASHLGHHLHHLGMHQYAHSEILTALGEPWIGAAIAAVALLGPGRKLVAEGFEALRRGNPNMNSLVGLGMSAAFSLSVLAVALPDLGWEAECSEEPVMLLAFVLLGRSLERQAQLRAQTDMRALASLLPASSRLVLNYAAPKQGAAAGGEDRPLQTAEVPTQMVRVGDVVQVLPGEAVPCDGVVLAGTSAVDESLLTGEPLPTVKAPAAAVTGGTVNCDGPLVVQATQQGQKGVLSGIAKLVEDAQARQAPIQRLADTVVAPFVGTVMSLSAATFLFWSTAGAAFFPDALEAAAGDADLGTLLVSLKLAIDVMVVACPCALGLATPTAVLVGTSMGATRGLLVRGGDVLERAAGVDTVVLDKTGTLTQGKPRVTAVAAAAAA